MSDRRPLRLESGSTYLLATDGIWNLPEPQRFIAQWPGYFRDQGRSLSASLDDLFTDLVLTSHPHADFMRGDNATAIALRVQ